MCGAGALNSPSVSLPLTSHHSIPLIRPFLHHCPRLVSLPFRGIPNTEVAPRHLVLREIKSMLLWINDNDVEKLCESHSKLEQKIFPVPLVAVGVGRVIDAAWSLLPVRCVNYRIIYPSPYLQATGWASLQATRHNRLYCQFATIYNLHCSPTYPIIKISLRFAKNTPASNT